MNEIYEENSFKPITDDEDKLKKATNNQEEIIDKLPTWSIEPPIEITRGDK